jgi:competence protein ComFC
MLTLETFISLIAPHECVGCGAEGALVCDMCRLDAFAPLPDRCYKCARLMSDGRVCPTCRRKSPLTHVWMRTAYEGTAKELVYRMKFARARAAAEVVGQLTVEALPYLQTEYVVVPVPTAAKRVRQRGYDHAALIARALARHEGFPMQVLLRRLGSARQVGANREVRLTQLQGAFYVSRPERVHGKDILLVDDIVTTGGSIEQAAQALRQAGARSVAAAIFAKKQ